MTHHELKFCGMKAIDLHLMLSKSVVKIIWHSGRHLYVAGKFIT
jgi:hypothetical protein